MAAPTTPLATLEHCFTLLTTGPGALTIDGNAVRHSLPPRPIPLDELRGLLHHLRLQDRRTAVDLLISRARTGSPAWLVGLAGVLLPGLRLLASQQANGNQTKIAEAQALTWFRTALAAHGAAADQRITWLLEAATANESSTRQDGE